MKNAKKIKVWSTKKADTEFSLWIRKRDGKCVFCGRTPPAIVLTCSHFWGRYASATRYDPENCDALCYGCHYKVENAKQGEYAIWKKKQLGAERYKALQDRYYQKKTTRRDEIIACMKLLNNYD